MSEEIQYRGIVEEITCGMAYMTLTSEDGRVFYCTKRAGCIEGLAVGDTFNFSLSAGIVPIPRRKMTEDEMAEMEKFFNNAFGEEQ